jgi:hypothetical protein
VKVVRILLADKLAGFYRDSIVKELTMDMEIIALVSKLMEDPCLNVRELIEMIVLPKIETESMLATEITDYSNGESPLRPTGFDVEFTTQKSFSI